MTVKKIFIAALCAALALSATSCAPLVQPGLRPGDRPPARPLTADLLMDRLLRKASLVHDLSATADFNLEAPGKEFSASEALLMKRPSKFRLETVSFFFGQPIFYVTSDGQNLNMFDPREKRLYIAPATAQTNFRVFGLRRSFDDLVAVLMGGVPLFLKPEELRMEHLGRDGAYLLEMVSRDGARQKVWFDSSTLNVVKSELTSESGRIEVEVIFESYTNHGGLEFPEKIELSLPLDEASLKVKYSKLKINQGLGDELFKLQVPEDVEVYLLR